MAAIVIRNIDEKVHAALKRQAKSHGRSAEAEARRILEANLMEHGLAKSAAAAFAEIRAALGGGVELETVRSKEPIEPADLT